jgi:hypothetical protein
MLSTLLSAAARPFAKSGTRASRIELRLAPPTPEPGARPPQFYTDVFKRELASLAEAPLEQLKLMRRECAGLSRVNFLVADRLDRTRQGLALFLPLLQQAMHTHGKEGGIPDTFLRRESLERCIEILGMLGQSYALVFKHHYDKGEAHFGKSMEQATLCATRVLELARLEQRARALRYQPLRETTWYLVNTLFHILRAHGDVGARVPVLESEVYASHAGRFTTPSGQFAAIQMTARMDMLRWPVAMQGLLAGYIEGNLDLLSMRDDAGRTLKSGQMLAYCQDDQAAGPRREEAPDARAILVDWSSLGARMREDCAALVQSARAGNRLLAPKTLRLLTNLESLSFAHLLIAGMRRAARAETVAGHEERVLGMRMYVTFREVYLHIHHIVGKQGRAPGKRFIDHFAERSAMIAEDHTTEKESIWYVLHQDSNIIRLKTEETDFTIGLGIGDLVSYAFGEADSHKPRLAVVRRLYRPGAGQVMIDLERLAKYAEPVLVTPLAAGQPEGDTLHALLMFDPDLGCNLLFSPKASVLDKSEARISFRGQTHDFTLGGLKYVTGGLYLFRMPLRMSQLGLDAPPSFAEPESAPTDAGNA